MMARQIKVMPDYQCYPLWAVGEEGPANIDPQTLPLSSEMVWRLEEWANLFDSWMDLDDPTSAVEPSVKAVVAFEAEGQRLWQRLKQELRPGYEIYYQSVRPSQLSNSWQWETTAEVNTFWQPTVGVELAEHV